MTFLSKPRYKVFLGGFLLILFMTPVLVSAAEGSLTLPYWGKGGIISCNATGEGKPRCTSLCDLLVTAQRILYFVVTVALFAIAPLTFIWGAFLLITAGGAAERVTAGRKILLSGVIGVIIILLAWIIVNSFFFIVRKVFNPDLLNPASRDSIGTSNWASFNIQCVPAYTTSTNGGTTQNGGSTNPGGGANSTSSPYEPGGGNGGGAGASDNWP